MDHQNNEENKNITIADVAEALGVSKTTVSRAISGKGRIGQETRDRVMAYIREYGYMPNAMARGLAKSKTFNLCVVMPDQYDVADVTFFQDCLLGIEKIAASQGYDLLLSICSNDNIESLERIVSNRKADGVILMRTYVDDGQIRFLKQHNVPFVAVGTSEEADVIQIDHDHRHACMELTQLLLMKGFKKIALIGTDVTQMVNHMRLNGFLDAHEQLKLSVEDAMIRMNLENSVLVSKAVREVVELGADAILCTDDAVASIVLRALNEAGLRVPEDIRLASFYGGPLLNNSLIPISTIHFEAVELGMVSCRVLIDLLDGVSVEQFTKLPFEVVLKESTQS